MTAARKPLGSGPASGRVRFAGLGRYGAVAAGGAYGFPDASAGLGFDAEADCHTRIWQSTTTRQRIY
jgi:hypothetical protein